MLGNVGWVQDPLKAYVKQFCTPAFLSLPNNKRVRLDVKSHAEVCNVCSCTVTEDQHWKTSSGCASKSRSYAITTTDRFINPKSRAGIFLIRWAFILQWPPFNVCHAGGPPARLTSWKCSPVWRFTSCETCAVDLLGYNWATMSNSEDETSTCN